MNYEVVSNSLLMEEFINWLPDLKPGETYYVALLARNKYAKHLGIGTFNSDKHNCKRFAATKKDLMDKIKQLECEVGTYVLKGIPIPQEALSLYITINPRDHVRATKQSLVKFAELVASGSTNHNVFQEAMSQLHKSPGTKNYLDIDFDGVKPEDFKKAVQGIINEDAVTILHTRGGFHALVDLRKVEKQYTKSWYNKVVNMPGADIRGDNMIPIPGSYQGGFMPWMQPLSQI
jgi:hypothetical protein